MAECKIMRCNCKHEGQDQLYGPGMRLFNPTGKGSDQGRDYICTICGAKAGGGGKKK